MTRAADGPKLIGRPVPDILDASVERYPARRAMTFLGRAWTYGDLGALVDRVAAGLQEQGVGKGTKVGLCLPNMPYSVVFFFAVMKAGGTVVNFSPLYVERELNEQMRDSGVTMMVVPDLKMIHGKVQAAAQGTEVRRIVVCPFSSVLPAIQGLMFSLLRRAERAYVPAGDGLHMYFRELLTGPARPEPVAIDPARDICLLQYTGGTSGTPKGAMLSHAAVSINAQQVIHHADCERIGVRGVVGVLPLFHVFAMQTVMLIPITLGAVIHLVPRFERGRLLDLIEREQPTLLPGVPTLYTALNAAPDIERRDLSSLNLSICGGAPLPHEVRTRFEELTGCKLVEGYGLSEASPVVTAGQPLGVVKPDSVGTALPGTIVEIRGLEEPHPVLGAGQVGEVTVRGPQLMAGYHNRPRETQQAFIEGALRTGDVGYLDTDGYLFLLDRIKDVIIVGGFNVYPRSIEEALYRHPAVAEAVAIGIPDSFRGEAPKAFVTLREGAEATPEQILAFLEKELSRVQMPVAVEIRESLPRTLVGKLSKKELVAEEKARAAS